MIGLICLGNPFHADDGFGTAVHPRLSGCPTPDEPRLHAGGEGGILNLLRHCRQAILISSLASHLGFPGQMMRLAADQIPADPQGPLGTGPASVLSSMRRVLADPPTVELLGAVALHQRPFSIGLSPMVAAAVETASAMVWREFGRARKGSAKPVPEISTL